jgi:hypothetical protein
MGQFYPSQGKAGYPLPILANTNRHPSKPFWADGVSAWKRTALYRVMEDYDRQARPWLYPWIKRERPAARRAKRSVKILPLTVSPVLLVAA